MAGYIAQLMDSSNTNVYPQVMADGVQGIDQYALKDKVLNLSDIEDTGWGRAGLVFTNGAYDFVDSKGYRHSNYRVAKIGKTSIVMLNFRFAIDKDVSSNFIQVLQFPEMIQTTGVYYTKNEIHDGVQVRLTTSGLEVKADPVLTADRYIYFQTMYFI